MKAVLLMALAAQPVTMELPTTLKPNCYRTIAHPTPVQLTGQMPADPTTIYTLRICYADYKPLRAVRVGIPDEPGKDNPDTLIAADCKLVSGTKMLMWLTPPAPPATYTTPSMNICVLGMAVIGDAPTAAIEGAGR
ncbi:hypothetical protein G7078_07800 [Sphingomonas sinipercae]|uniref:Uncharacterized protein n=1 Tax=Sphingomonas sinipercae TaxID=2714944 RepID=A0A6G7ZP38_9SPHN|nr:hypothetical protein [Sphingomonas sinipercae]QIL02695.1 hypothetical protein G7078_07800 [Sphingomonas sinipercae]